MATPTSSFAFPHPTLTAIVGAPTNTTITKLIQEVFANARAVPSTRGGGGHGHLGMIMTAPKYLTLAGTAFQLPIHPGDTPTIPPTQTQYEITEGVRLYKATIAELTLATSLREEIKKQILAAVERMYFEILEDATFGFADVSVIDLLTHLTNTYSKITRADLETNRASIATIWPVTDPIELLWNRLREVQRISAAGGEALSDDAIMDLTIIMFESTGVFPLACNMWRLRPTTNKTYVEFREFFTTENKERLKKPATTGTSGYHSANAATAHPSKLAQKPAPKPAPIIPPVIPAPTPAVTTNDGIVMFYCWTHGLGFNKNHTSATCSNPAEGHCLTATVKNLQGGNSSIMSNRPGPKPETSKAD